MIERILDTIKQSVDEKINDAPKRVGLILYVTIDKKLFKLDKILNDELKELIKQNIKKYVESKIDGLIVKVSISHNSIYVCDAETYVLAETLFKAWGKRLYYAYIDEPCTTRFVKFNWGYICNDYISMSRIRRIESSEMFQNDWKRWKRKKFEDRFKGFESTSYKPENENNTK